MSVQLASEVLPAKRMSAKDSLQVQEHVQVTVYAVPKASAPASRAGEVPSARYPFAMVTVMETANALRQIPANVTRVSLEQTVPLASVSISMVMLPAQVMEPAACLTPVHARRAGVVLAVVRLYVAQR